MKEIRIPATDFIDTCRTTASVDKLLKCTYKKKIKRKIN